MIADYINKKYSGILATQKLSQEQINKINVFFISNPLKIKAEKSKKEQEYTIKKEKRDLIRQDLHKNLQKMQKLTSKIESLKAEIHNIKSKQLDYYIVILQNGTDLRQEGLIWIIKAIWSLGYNVPLTKMPKYLDQQAIQFLFNFARLDMEAAELQKALIKKYNSSKKSKLELGIELPVIPEKEFMNPKSPNEDREIAEIERLIEKAKSKIRELKQAEITRIFKEFIENGYEKKYGINQKDLIISLIGEEEAKYEFKKQLKDREEYIKNKMRITSCSFGRRNSENPSFSQSTIFNKTNLNITRNMSNIMNNTTNKKIFTNFY